MNELAARKRLIVAQADLYRQLLAVERLHLQERWAPVRMFADRNRWWLLAGAVAGGLVLAPYLGKVLVASGRHPGDEASGA